MEKSNALLREATSELEKFSGTDLDVDKMRREVQFLTDRYDQRSEILRRLREGDKSAVKSSSETQNESDIERRRRAITETQNYLGGTATAPASGNATTPPTKATSTCSETETEGMEEIKDSESSANEAEQVHRTMLSAVNDLPDDHYREVEDGPCSPPSPFADKESAVENQTMVPETPQSQLGPSATSTNTNIEQTEKKWSPIKYPGNSPKKIVVAEPMVQKKTIGDRLGPPLPPKRIHERVGSRSSHGQNSTPLTTRPSNRPSTQRNLRNGSIDPSMSGHPFSDQAQQSNRPPFGTDPRDRPHGRRLWWRDEVNQSIRNDDGWYGDDRRGQKPVRR